MIVTLRRPASLSPVGQEGTGHRTGDRHFGLFSEQLEVIDEIAFRSVAAARAGYRRGARERNWFVQASSIPAQRLFEFLRLQAQEELKYLCC